MALSLRRRFMAAVVVMMVLPVSAGAQTVSFAELRNYVKAGDRISLTDASGDNVTGKVEDLTTSAVTLLLDQQKKTFLDANVRRVVVKDSLRNGSLIGLAIGAVPGIWLGTVFKTYCHNEASSCPAAPLIFGAVFGGIGAGVGAGIDGLFHRQINVLPSRIARVSVLPVVSRERRAVVIGIRF